MIHNRMENQTPCLFRLAMVLAVTAAGIERSTAEDLVDLPALIECNAGVQDWGELAFAIMGDPGSTTALGWAAIESPNPFLQEYRLPTGIHVFGYETDHIALMATGPMAVLAGIDARQLAATLGGVDEISAAPGQFLGEKIVVNQNDESDGMTFRTRISINISTVETHPGAVLAGCSYVTEMIDG